MYTNAVHDFKIDLREAEKCEQAIDRVFSQWYIVEPVPVPVNKIGIDRLWTHRIERVRYSVEYKTDWKTAETGNAFVETVSVDGSNKPGWGYTCSAQLLVYYVPQWAKAYLISTVAIKNNIAQWRASYKEKFAQNQGYKTGGLPVPWREFKRWVYDEEEMPSFEKGRKD